MLRTEARVETDSRSRNISNYSTSTSVVKGHSITEKKLASVLFVYKALNRLLSRKCRLLSRKCQR